MTTLTDRLEQLAELQKKNLEPFQQLNGAAFSAFERIARKNYELMGDMVEYAVAQTRGQLEESTPQELYARQMAEAKAFAEKIGARASEYVALADEMRDSLGNRMEEMSEAGSATAARSAESVREASDEAVAATPLDAGSAGGSKKKSASKKKAAASSKKSSAKKAPASKKRAGAGSKKG